MTERIEQIIPQHYACRLKAHPEGGIRVYGDLFHTLVLGRVKELSDGLKMLDAYDLRLVERRAKIAEIIDEQNLMKLREKGL